MSDIQLHMDINEYLPLRDVVFNTLREGILTGNLKPGERLMEIHLANRLGVSRTPIREAIRMLELEGLVTMVPRKGAEVSRISKKDLSDVLEVRRALDGLATQLAASRITKEQKAELISAKEKFEACVASKDIRAIAEADVSFHDVILNASDNGRLVQMVNNLSERMYRYRLEYIKDERNHSKIIDDHAEIVKCILNGDEVSAASAAKKHIDNQEINVLNQLETI